MDDAVLKAIAVADEASTSMYAFGPMNDKWMRGFASALIAQGLTVARATTEQLRAHGKERITHGRHCACSSCAREHWSLYPGTCGMHGPICPDLYDPRGMPGAILNVKAEAARG